jgi:hypothetical protein
MRHERVLNNLFMDLDRLCILLDKLKTYEILLNIEARL